MSLIKSQVPPWITSPQPSINCLKPIKATQHKLECLTPDYPFPEVPMTNSTSWKISYSIICNRIRIASPRGTSFTISRLSCVSKPLLFSERKNFCRKRLPNRLQIQMRLARLLLVVRNDFKFHEDPHYYLMTNVSRPKRRVRAVFPFCKTVRPDSSQNVNRTIVRGKCRTN